MVDKPAVSMKRIGLSTLVAAIWLSVWEAAYLLVGMDIILPSPWQVCLTLGTMVVSLSFWQTIGATVLRVLIGFAAGFLIGAVLAVLSFRFSFVKRLFSPMISAIKSTPVASIIILALFWLAAGTVPTFICVLMVLPVTYDNVLQGLCSVDSDLIEMSRVYCFSFARRLKSVYIPSILPYVSAAAGIGLGLGWKAGLAAEVICRSKVSIGNAIYETKLSLEAREMFAWTVAVILLSVVFDRLLKRLSAQMTGKRRLNKEAKR